MHAPLSTYLLALVLLVSASVPCGLAELGAEAFCAEPASAVEQVCNDGAETPSPGDDLAHLDCCAGCLACCGSYVEAPTPGALLPAAVDEPTPLSMEREPMGAPCSIWRPPRA